MKKLIFAYFIISVFLIGCAGTPSSGGASVSKPDLSALLRKEWRLTEVWINGINSGFTRSSLPRDGSGEMFTITFDEELLSGTGAPNRFSAPYIILENNAITVLLIRATLMATTREPPRLREHDFLTYLQNSTVWNIEGNNLTLTSRNSSGARVFLIFSWTPPV
jgi:heat shock protein HslJ